MSQKSSGAIGAISKGDSVISTVVNWTLNPPSVDSSSVATSNSKGGVITITGAKDTSGSFVTKGLIPVAFPGEKFTFRGFCGPSSGNVRGSDNGVIYSVPVIISSISLSFDFNSADALGWTYSFSGDGGPWSETTGTMPDNSTPLIETIQGATISAGHNVTAGSITITSAISGGIATSDSNGYKIRLAGPISGTAQLTCILTSVSTIDLSIDEDVALVLTSSSGTILTFKWWKITGLGSVTVDNNSAEPESFTVEGAFSAHNGTGYGEISVGNVTIFPVNEP